MVYKLILIKIKTIFLKLQGIFLNKLLILKDFLNNMDKKRAMRNIKNKLTQKLNIDKINKNLIKFIK